MTCIVIRDQFRLRVEKCSIFLYPISLSLSLSLYRQIKTYLLVNKGASDPDI